MRLTDIILFILLLILTTKACKEDKDVVKGTINMVKYYSDYADSVFNDKNKIDTIKIE